MPGTSGLADLFKAYFFNKKRWPLWGLFILILAGYGVNIRLAVLLNDWNGRFFNALQAVDKEAIFNELMYFIVLCAAIIVLLVWVSYVEDRLKIAVRRDLTGIFFERWLSPASAFFLLKESGEEPDNPDQRITEDVKNFVTLSVDLTISFYNSMLTLGSFSVILWNLSGPITVFGVTVPGYMFWVCVLYTIVATAITHLIGRKLKKLNIDAQHMEANLRASLIDKHRHADAIAGSRAEAIERENLLERLRDLVKVLVSLVKRKRDLNLFTVGIGQFTYLAPIFFALPSFLSGRIQLGGLMQIRGAFNDVARSLCWFIQVYESLAQLAAAYERLRRLEAGLSRAESAKKELMSRITGGGEPLRADITLEVPQRDGQARLLPVSFTAAPGTLTLVLGPSGIGKSTFLKAAAGFNGRFKGVISEEAPVIWIPQTPYMPAGTLKELITYPKDEGSISDEEALSLLRQAGLGAFAPSLHKKDNWTERLSGGEKQRLMLLRAVAARPRLLLLDETTSGLDTDLALSMIRLLKRYLPETAIVLVTHQRGFEGEADQIVTLKNKEEEK